MPKEFGTLTFGSLEHNLNQYPGSYVTHGCISSAALSVVDDEANKAALKAIKRAVFVSCAASNAAKIPFNLTSVELAFLEQLACWVGSTARGFHDKVRCLLNVIRCHAALGTRESFVHFWRSGI